MAMWKIEIFTSDEGEPISQVDVYEEDTATGADMAKDALEEMKKHS